MLGGGANIAYSYATKRYRSNCINWGILPFTVDQLETFPFDPDDTLFVPNIREAVETGAQTVTGHMVRTDGTVAPITLHLPDMTADERQIILEGCLMNYYAAGYGKD